MSTVASGNRSPAYPYLDLKKAVEKAQEAYTYARRSEADIIGLYKHWGFSGETGTSRKVFAALKYFGLLDHVHGKPTVKLSDRALRIVLDHDGSPAKATALIDAFLSPKIYRYCWEKWGAELPHDNAVRSHLLFEKGFNESSVGGFLADYKLSMQYSGVLDSENGKEKDQILRSSPPVAIGDWAQWESGGQAQFQEPRQITGISDDGLFAFIEGINSAVPIDELEKREAPGAGGEANRKQNSPVASPSAPHIPKLEVNMRQDTFTLDEGQIVIQWPATLSKESYQDFEDWLAILQRKIKRSITQERTVRSADDHGEE